MKPEAIPKWLWRLVLAVLLASILSILLLLVLALAGISNPKHIGALVVRDELDRNAGWAMRPANVPAGVTAKVDNGVYRITLPHRQTHAVVVAPYQAHAPCTIMLAARQFDGPTDAGYGLWWGDASGGNYHVAAVNGDGYLTVFQLVDGGTEAIMEWQVFPRIHTQGETNTLQVDIDGGQVLIRVNDEVAATFEWATDRPLEIGFYAETLSAGGTIADLDWLAIWEDPD